MAKTQTIVLWPGGCLTIRGRVTRQEAIDRARDCARRDLEAAQKRLRYLDGDGVSVRAWHGNQELALPHG